MTQKKERRVDYRKGMTAPWIAPEPCRAPPVTHGDSHARLPVNYIAMDAYLII